MSLSVFEEGGSGSEQFKECPPLSPTVLWFVNEQQKQKKIKNKTKQKKVFLRKGILKYAANLQENTHPEVQFQ